MLPLNLHVSESRTSERRPKLLFLARPFPPARVSACQRTWNVAKYLSRLGWDVTVVTPSPSVWRQPDDSQEVELRLKKEGVRRILTEHHLRFLRPNGLKSYDRGIGRLLGGFGRRVATHAGIDSGAGWVTPAEQACSSLTSNDVDVVLATGAPFASFELAKRLAGRLGCPYVLDYRDPWTQNPHRAAKAKPWVARKEAKLLAGSAAVTIVSPSWAEVMNHRFHLGKKLHVVSNGYDPEELEDVIPHQFGHFAIVYAGGFYPPKRVISPVMAALKRLKGSTNGQDWYFHYYGKQGDHVLREAERFGVTEKVICHGLVPHSEALSATRGANLVVVITSVEDKAGVTDQGIMTGKIFETLGLRRPILVIAPRGSDLEALAAKTKATRLCTGSEVSAMAEFIAELISGRTQKTENEETYAWPNIIRQLDLVLQQAVGTKLARETFIPTPAINGQ